ncbi:MAG: RNA 2',3'-cyclic phosphodiesterase [Gammaproteobacteria bacterium]|nr:RNA 2',3'-cyclic phosphodiesterase [Gammaproteobacteria bacterium]
MAETERLFLALWPDASLQQAIHTEFNRHLRHCDGRNIPTPNIHLTLLFLGNVLADQHQCLETSISELNLSKSISAFDLKLDRPVYRQRQQILWLEPDEIPEPLEQLVKVLRDACTSCGLELESRSFKAHVTLARKIKKRILPEKIQTWGVKPFHWQVNEFALVESKTFASGAEYTVLKRWPLARK